MKIFISWSGKQSKGIAEALRDWIPDVIQAAEPWMSASDIEVGARWAEELSRELNRIRFGIVCLTRDNLTSPWILFEAGALSTGLHRSRVCPYLIGVEPKDVPSPLAQFQAVLAEKAGTKALMHAINKALLKTALSEARLDKYFENAWPDLNKKLKVLRA